MWNSELKGLIYRRIKTVKELNSLLVDPSLNTKPLNYNHFYVTGALVTMTRTVLESLVNSLGGRFSKWANVWNIPRYSYILVAKSPTPDKVSDIKFYSTGWRKLNVINEKFIIDLAIQNGLLPEKIKEELDLSECLLEL